jgi:hypothetical protein
MGQEVGGHGWLGAEPGEGRRRQVGDGMER